MAVKNLGPCVLEGKFVQLEPLRRQHADELTIAAGKLDWGWMLTPLRSRKDVEKWITQAGEIEKKGIGYVFAIHLKKDKRIVGNISYFDVAPAHKHAEIGTWIEQDLWGSVVNPECKLLTLQHAFEDWQAIRMQFTTDVNNVHSQRALLKLGAVFEARLKNHCIRPDGSIRDTLLYSISSTEWPKVKRILQNRVEA